MFACRFILLATVMLAVLCSRARAADAPPPADEVAFTVFNGVQLDFEKEQEEEAVAERDGLQFRNRGQTADVVIDLPALPVNQRDARRITATVRIEPAMIEAEGKFRPGDPWTRLGSIETVLKDKQTGRTRPIEIMRFVTGFGSAGQFTQDVTSFAPLLSGHTTIRLTVRTYLKPGWRVWLTLHYSREGAGYRRPVFAQGLINETDLDATRPSLEVTVRVPETVERPRLIVLSTGHATDGTAGDEFISRTHILRVDGREIARWRPWSERGGEMRHANPASGRSLIDGRELWSSDLDRSGWSPGRLVEPLIIPCPELGPGQHTISLEIQGIRPRDDSGRGFWRTSVCVVADESWPDASPAPAPPTAPGEPNAREGKP